MGLTKEQTCALILGLVIPLALILITAAVVVPVVVVVIANQRYLDMTTKNSTLPFINASMPSM